MLRVVLESSEFFLQVLAMFSKLLFGFQEISLNLFLCFLQKLLSHILKLLLVTL